MTSRFRLSLKYKTKSSKSSIQKKSSQTDRSGVSLKSDQSRNPDINFKERNSFAEKSDSHYVPHSSSKKHKNAVFKMLKRTVISLIKNELKKFKKMLSPDYPQFSEKDEEDDEGQSDVRDGVLKITLHVLRKMNQTDLANTLLTTCVILI